MNRAFRHWRKALLLLLIGVIYAAWPGCVTLTISPETTYLTAPIGEDGYIDYPRALNEYLSKDVTPETNANVLIVRALGPKPEGANLPPEYYQWLGIPEPPEQGDYFIIADKFRDLYLRNRPADPRIDAKEPKLADGKEQRDVLIGPNGELPQVQTGDDQSKWSDHASAARKWPWKAEDEPDLAAWLKLNEKPLAIVAEASRRPTYYNPLVSGRKTLSTPRLLSALIPTTQRSRAVAQALACRAMMQTGAGNFDAAWADLMTCHRLGRLLSKGGTLTENLVSIAVRQIAMTAEVALLSHAFHPASRVRVWLDEFRRLPPMSEFAVHPDISERYLLLDALTSVAYSGQELDGFMDRPDAKSGSSRLFTRSVNYDPAFQVINQLFDRSVAACRLTTRSARQGEFRSLAAEYQASRVDAAERNIVQRFLEGPKGRGKVFGIALAAVLIPLCEKSRGAVDRSEQTEANLQIALALALFRAETGKYPISLTELAPKYLPQVPIDLFSERQLLYRRTDDGYLLYSVGPNGQDDGGQSVDDVPKGDDISIRMPIPKPVGK
jgi:hypothetical protein